MLRFLTIFVRILMSMGLLGGPSRWLVHRILDDKCIQEYVSPGAEMTVFQTSSSVAFLAQGVLAGHKYMVVSASRSVLLAPSISVFRPLAPVRLTPRQQLLPDTSLRAGASTELGVHRRPAKLNQGIFWNISKADPFASVVAVYMGKTKV